jgi:hypothetical protein
MLPGLNLSRGRSKRPLAGSTEDVHDHYSSRTAVHRKQVETELQKAVELARQRDRRVVESGGWHVITPDNFLEFFPEIVPDFLIDETDDEVSSRSVCYESGGEQDMDEEEWLGVLQDDDSEDIFLEQEHDFSIDLEGLDGAITEYEIE